jgi:hypothetical protein
MVPLGLMHFYSVTRKLGATARHTCGVDLFVYILSFVTNKRRFEMIIKRRY